MKPQPSEHPVDALSTGLQRFLGDQAHLLGSYEQNHLPQTSPHI